MSVSCSKSKVTLLAITAALTTTIIACSGAEPEERCAADPCPAEQDPPSQECAEAPCDRVDAAVELDQGAEWEPFRALYRYTSQGSRLIPYRWLLALESAESDTKFVDADHMQELGFIIETNASAESRALNPDGLPIGLVKDPRMGRYDEEWAGLTCSACHTSTIEYQGTSFLVDGGSGLLDLERTEREMVAAVEATLADDAKLFRFIDDVVGPEAAPAERERLQANLADFGRSLQARLDRNASAVPGALVGQSGTLPLPPGPGRVDAFTILVNETICQMLPEPENCRPANTPTSYLHLWGVGDLDWAQTNSLTHAVLGRNVGEVLGVYAHSSLENCSPDHPQLCDFESSADIENLVELEEWLKVLDAPQWPEQFGTIDADLAQQGREVYQRSCASCHALPDDNGVWPTMDPNPDNPNPCREFVATSSTPICFDYGGIDLLGGLASANCNAPITIGTDPFLAANFLARTGKTGILAPLFDGAEEATAARMQGAIGALIIGQAFARAGFTPAEMQRALDYRATVEPSLARLTGYKSRPLAGIAFTAPFLHNNSVPSIDELLRPPSERVTEFWVGRREYDPTKLGYVSTAPEAGEDLFRFDTTIPGNRNTGHEFGPAAANYEGDRASDRRALIEFIKTLDETPRTEPTPCAE